MRSLRRKRSSAQVRNVRFWPKADIRSCTAHVRFWGQSGHDRLRMSAFAVAIGGEADIAFAAHMSAYDPKRTLTCFFSHSPPGRKVLGYSHRTKRGPSRSAHATT